MFCAKSNYSFVLKVTTVMFQETRILEETTFNKQQPVVCIMPVPLKTPVTHVVN